MIMKNVPIRTMDNNQPPFLTNLCDIYNKKILLASQSPRRIEMLRSIGLSFEIVPADVDETPETFSDPADFAEQNAREKAQWVWERHDADLVIAADTIVVKNEEIFGKPVDRGDAFRMLNALSDTTHQVVSGVCLQTANEEIVDHEITEVSFYPLSNEEISAYIDTGEIWDKAGAYAIQGFAGVFVKSIYGSYPNVMGFPLAKFYQDLRQLKW